MFRLRLTLPHFEFPSTGNVTVSFVMSPAWERSSVEHINVWNIYTIYAIYTIYTIYAIYTIYTIYAIYTIYTIYAIYTIYTIYAVYTIYVIQTGAIYTILSQVAPVLKIKDHGAATMI